MAKPKKKKTIRTEFRKNRSVRARDKDYQRELDDDAQLDEAHSERISGKGALTRKRTVVVEEVADGTAGTTYLPQVDAEACRPGRVLRVMGLVSEVVDEEGQHFSCATRRLLKTLHSDQRNAVVAGDHVWFRPESEQEGIIERVEPRRGVLSRTSRGRQHILVAHVDQMLIVSSAAEPYLKPNLIDRFLVTAEKAELVPIIGINKVDLVEPADLQPLVGVYTQMGYQVLLLSAKTGQGVEQLRHLLRQRDTVVAGQSGVGKSSLLNTLDANLQLRVSHVSADTQKGRHTTTTAQLLPLPQGGHVVDTPGIRQFQLWDVIPAEVAGFFRDLRPYVCRCQYPDCTHTHEVACGVKHAVADGRLDARRYESYVQMQTSDDA